VHYVATQFSNADAQILNVAVLMSNTDTLVSNADPQVSRSLALASNVDVQVSNVDSKIPNNDPHF
jgi:hypothetical protein